MKRVNPETLSSVLAGAAKTVLLFGAPTGDRTMAQASVFAELWIAHRDSVAFAYVDAFDHVKLARAYKIGRLPTTLVLEGDQIVARFDGFCPPTRIEAALNGTAPMRTAA